MPAESRSIENGRETAASTPQTPAGVAPLNTARGALLAAVTVALYFKRHGRLPDA